MRLPCTLPQSRHDRPDTAHQVTEADLELWREGLADRDRVTVRLYPALNHLFAPGAGTATPAEYTGQVKHVAPQVLEDLAEWIHGASR